MLYATLQNKGWIHGVNTCLICLLILADRTQSTCIYNADEYCKNSDLTTSLDETKVCYVKLDYGKHLPSKHVKCTMEFDGEGFSSNRYKICFQMIEIDIDDCGLSIQFYEDTVWKGNTGSKASRSFHCGDQIGYKEWCTKTGLNGYISLLESDTQNSSFKVEVTAESITAPEMEMNSNHTRNVTAPQPTCQEEMPCPVDSRSQTVDYRQNNMPDNNKIETNLFTQNRQDTDKGTFTYNQPPPSYDDLMQ